MYNPKFTITNSILNNVVKLEIDRHSIETTTFSTKTRNRLAERAKNLNLFHMAHILNINVTLKDASKISDGKKIITEDARGTILNNFRNALEFTRSNISETYIDIDLNILMHINKILLTDWKEDWEAKLRTGGEEIDTTLDNWATLRDERIEPLQLQSELISLIDWYKSNNAKVHDLIRIAVFVERLIQICPFVHLNKLTTIAVADFLLYKNGLSSKSHLPSTRVFDVYQDEYFEALSLASSESINSTQEESPDITLWIERFVRNLSNDMNETKEELSKQIQEEEKGSKQPFLDLNKRQLKILRYLQTIPTVKREDYVQMMNVSTMTAYRDLNELTEKKLIKVEGMGRGTKYMLANR